MKKLLLSLSLVAVVSAPAFGAQTTSVPASKEQGKISKAWNTTKAAVWTNRCTTVKVAEIAAVTAAVGGVSYAAYRYFKAPAKRAAVNADLLTTSVAAKALSTRANEALNFIATHKKLVALALAGVAVVGFEALDAYKHGFKNHEEVLDADDNVTKEATTGMSWTKDAYAGTKAWTIDSKYGVKNTFAFGFEKPNTFKHVAYDAALVGIDLAEIVTAVVLLDAMTTYLVDLKGQMYTVALINKIFAKNTKDAQVVAAQPAIA